MDIIEITKGEDGLTIISGNRDGIAKLGRVLLFDFTASGLPTGGKHNLVDHEGHETKIALWLRW